MKKLLYVIACKVITKFGKSEVVPYDTFLKSEDLLERAYRFYLTSNREESEEAYIQGLFNMAKLFINNQRIKKIKNRIYEEVYSHGKSGRNL